MAHRHTSSCRKAFRFICENLDADLNSPECREIREHVEGCANCTAYLASLKRTVSLYRAYPAPSLSASVRRDLLKAVCKPRSRRSPRV